MNVSVDESGNTGQHLLDPQQPVYALASTAIESSLAEKLVRNVAGQMKELKYSVLSKTSSGRKRVLQLLGDDAVQAQTRTVIVNKPYMASAKLVDLLIEPIVHDTGGVLYAQGNHLMLTGFLHWVVPEVIGRKATTHLMQDFVTMIWKRTELAFTRFFDSIASLRESCDDAHVSHFLEMVASSDDIAKELILKGGLELVDELDPAIPCLFVLLSWWTGRAGAPFDLVHDDAKVIVRWKPYLDELADLDKPPRALGYDEKRVHLPFLVDTLRFVSSEAEPGVQIADVVAGATMDWGRVAIGSKEKTAYTEALEALVMPLVEIGVETARFLAE